MQMIDDELDVVIFPYTRPKMMSNRILLSDTLYTMHHHIFFDQRKDVANHISQLTDLRAYKVGSYPRHRGEPSLRLAGLTIHYSSGFDASFEKLLSGDIDFIVDEKIKVLHYISTLLDEDVSYIDFLPFQLFPDYFYAIAPVKNEAASAVISKLNDLIADEPFYKEMIDLYFEKLRR
jgi:ABC-type amino acid transport substrate-binding protein